MLQFFSNCFYAVSSEYLFNGFRLDLVQYTFLFMYNKQRFAIDIKIKMAAYTILKFVF